MNLYTFLLDASESVERNEEVYSPDELCRATEVESIKIIERIKETYGEDKFATVLVMLESLSYYQALCEGDGSVVVAVQMADLTPFIQRIAIAAIAVWEQGKETTENSTV